MTRTITDRQINEGAKFYPHREADSENDATSHPCIELGGDEHGDGAMQVYVYADEGRLVISLHYDTAGPDEAGNGPWAYYGPDGACIPTVVIGGSGEPVWQATAEGETVAIGVIARATPAWLAYAGIPLDQIPDDGQREAVRRHREAQQPPVWNVTCRVVARVRAENRVDAIATLHGRLSDAGFGLLDAPGYSAAFPAGLGEWQATVTAVACRRAPYGARALTELRDALTAAGFTMTAPRPRDWFRAEDGTEVTPLPGEQQ